MKRQLFKTATLLVNARGGHRSSGRRLSVWRKTRVVWLSLTLVLVPLLGGRTRLTPPAQAQVSSCGGADRIFQGCPLGGPYEISLENQALDDLLTLHQLPAGDRSRLLGWQRGELRTLLFDKLLGLIKKAGARTPEEQAAVTAFATRIKQRRVDAAQFAVDEYNSWQRSPCTYSPPAGFSYPGVQRCAAARTNPALAGPIDPPTFEEFQAYGATRAYAVFQDLSTQQAIDQAVRGSVFFGGVAAGGVLGAVVAANLSANIIKALFPFGTAKFTGAVVGGGTRAVAFGTRFFAFGGPILIVVTSIVTAVLRGIEVAAISQLPGKLQAKLDEVRNASLDLAQLIATETGRQEAFGAFIVMTLPDYPATGPIPAPQASDPKFLLRQEGSTVTTISPTISFLTGEIDFEVQSARLNGGWFINKYKDNNVEKERWTLRIDYANWNGERWMAARAGAGFIHTKVDDSTQSFESPEIRYKDGNSGNNFTASLLLAALEIEALPVVLDRGHQEPGIDGIASQTLPVALVNSGGQAPNTLAVAVNNGESATVTGVTISNLSVDSQGRVTASLLADCTASAPTFTLKVTDNTGQTKTALLTIQLSPLANLPRNPLPGALPEGAVGAPYNGLVRPTEIFAGACSNVSGASNSITSGKLPPGLSLGAVYECTGGPFPSCSVLIGQGIVGTPTSGGTYEFTLRRSYSNGDNFSRTYTVNIASNPAPLPSGALSWWSGERGLHDDLGQNHLGLTGTFGNDNFAPGKVGLAFRFDGERALRLPGNFFPFNAANNPRFTFETWFKTAESGVIIGQYVNGNPPTANTPGIYVGTNGKLHVQMFRDTTGAVNLISSAAAVNDDDFHHVAVVYDGTRQVVYLDGSLMGSNAQAQASSPGNFVYHLGMGYTRGWPWTNQAFFYFNGLIDEPTLYNRALSEEEVRGIYAAGSAGKIQITVTPFNPVCAGTFTGVILASALGHNAPYTFGLDSNTITGSISLAENIADGVLFNLQAENYTVKIKDRQGRIVTQAVTLTDPAPPTATISGGGLIRPGQTAVVNVALSGGAATYTVTLNNNGGTRTGASPLSFTIGPQSTTTYAIESATAADGCPVTLNGTATITVDSTPPTIACPANQSGVIAGTSGPVTYIAPTVSDNQPGAPVSCTPASGATFALGVTPVNCTARDAVGNTAGCGFTVTVRQPRPASKDLIARVRALAPNPLTTAQASQLLGHLEMANTHLERGQTSQACTHLQNFVNGVSAFVTGGQLTTAQGQSLTSYANQIRNAVGCAGSPFPT